MEEINSELNSVIELLKKVREQNSRALNECPEDKLLCDAEYGRLFQSLWTSDFKLKNLIILLEVIDKSLKAELKFSNHRCG